MVLRREGVWERDLRSAACRVLFRYGPESDPVSGV